MKPDLLTSHDALFSPCRTWRYWLARTWDDTQAPCCWLMLNPSWANETRGDRTTTRCVNFAKSWGYGAHWALNLYAFVSPHPVEMFKADDPVGPKNDQAIATYVKRAARRGGIVIAAWGAAPRARDRQERVRDLVAKAGVELHALSFTAGGAPRHPLYLPKTLRPQLWAGRKAA